MIVELLAEVEAMARERARQLHETGRLADGLAALYAPTPPELREARRLAAALALAESADVFVALARGRAVPAALLDRALLREAVR
ncbi:MAG: hypothetical protein IRZ04_19175 [Rhodospirillales bacterium]|nr:hypothetical protein [Rhodospirillales bacterium]